MKKIFLMVIIPNFYLSICLSQNIIDKKYRSSIEKAARFCADLRDSLKIPGISVCVGTKEKILWAQGFGKADLENNVPVTPVSKFRLGSVSKCLTSIAIGKLYEEGKLNLDIPVQTYVPGFPVKKYPVTTRQLAGHLAGIRHYRMSDPLHPRRFKNVTEGLAIFENDSLLFEPGTKYSYSTYAYTLLSAAIEGAAKQEFLSYMRQEVFLPLSMTNTIADHNDSIISNRVRFYDHTGRNFINAPLVDNSYKWAGGGYLSTPTDLVKLGQGLLNATILKKQTIELLFTPQRLKNGTPVICGITWRIEKDGKGRKIIHHGGAIEGGRTFIILYPDQDLIIALFANRNVGSYIDKKEMDFIAELFL